MNKISHSILSMSLGICILFITSCSSLYQKPDSEWTDKEFYDRAKESFDDKQWKSAIEYFEKLKSYYPYGEYTEKSYLKLAYSYYEYKEIKSAIQETEEFIRLFPNHKKLHYAYYLRALAKDSINKHFFDDLVSGIADKRDVKSTKEALQYYKKLVHKFPTSEHAPKSQKRIVFLTKRLAKHEYLVSIFYFKRKAYLAAISRSQYLINTYPNSEFNLKALEIIKKSYFELKIKNSNNTKS